MAKEYYDLQKKQTIISRMDRILLERVHISNILTKTVTEINELLGLDEDITSQYKEKLNTMECTICQYPNLCERLECLATEVEDISKQERNNDYFIYLVNNLDNYCAIVSMKNDGHNNRVRSTEELLAVYQRYPLPIGPFGENMREMTTLLKKEIIVIKQIIAYNDRFSSALVRIVNKINELSN